MAKSVDKLNDVANESAKTLQAAGSVLQRSFDKVTLFYGGRDKKYSEDQVDAFEALIARFSRLSDFMFQRMMRVLDQIELIDEGTAIDRLNRCEKRGIITDSQIWKELRVLRNNAAHEYLIEGSDIILEDVLKYTPELLGTVQRCLDYMKKNNYLLANSSVKETK